MRKYVTCEEVAEALRLSPPTVRRLCREGRIPGVKIGRRWLFDEDVIHSLVTAPDSPTEAEGDNHEG